MDASSKTVPSLRCRISHRPAFQFQEPVFFRCGRCGNVLVGHAPLSDTRPTRYEASCCGFPMDLLEARGTDRVLTHNLSFTVFGGFEHNALELHFGTRDATSVSHDIEWVYLHTFQGGQLKRPSSPSCQMVRFAFADNDAYVYCNREVCRMSHEPCQFECKRGFVVYAYCRTCGLMRWYLQGIRA